MNNLNLKLRYFIIILIILFVTSIFLYPYDSRINLYDKNKVSKNDESKNDSIEDMDIRNLSKRRKQSDAKMSEGLNNFDNIENGSLSGDESNIIGGVKDTEEMFDPRTYYIELDAEYYRKKSYDFSLENLVYREKIPKQEIINGDYMLYSFYKIKRDSKGNLSRIEHYGGYYDLEEFTDFEYDEHGLLSRIITYDDMVNVLSTETREYNSLGYLLKRSIRYAQNKDSDRYVESTGEYVNDKEFIYSYNDVTGSEEIRIEKRFGDVFEVRYSFYNNV